MLDTFKNRLKDSSGLPEDDTQAFVDTAANEDIGFMMENFNPVKGLHEVPFLVISILVFEKWEQQIEFKFLGGLTPDSRN